MIRIVHVISGLEVGGAEIMLANLVGRRDRKNFEHKVISLTSFGDVGAQIAGAGIEVVALEMAAGRPNLTGLMKLVQVLRRDRPMILQSWLYHGDFAGLIAAKLAGVPHLVWNIQGSRLAEASLLLRGIIRVLALSSRVPDAVVVNSTAGAAWHKRLGYRPRRWLEIPNGVDTAIFRPHPEQRAASRAALGIASDAFVVGLVARVHPMKDHATFLAAASKFAAMVPGAVFVLVGAGTEPGARAFGRLAASSGLGDRLRCLGKRADLTELYPAFDLATLSSAYGEGCPNVLLEAMACGVPCVATDIGDCARIIGDTGLVVAPRDPGGLAAAWAAMMSSNPQARGKAARERTEALFEVGHVVDTYQRFYAQLAAAELIAEQPKTAAWSG